MKKRIWHDVPNHPELKVGQYVVPNFVSNSVMIHVDDQNTVVVSPGKALLENCPIKEQADDIVLHIIMPNGYHFMGVEEWQKVFPNHKLYASRDAIQMLSDKMPSETVNSIHTLEETSPPLPNQYSVLIPPGHRGGDAWLVKQSEQGDTWITCDSFLNYDRMSNQPIARFLQKLLSAAPGLKISKVIKYFILKDRRTFKQWVLDQLNSSNLTTLIPSHGEVNQSPSLASELRSLVEKQL
mgnify:CR=1 FL=1